MMPKNIIISTLLIDIERELRKLNLWQCEKPKDEDLVSQLPFCVDTLAFHQWLQFVFIEKMKKLIFSNSPLPQVCAIAPMAEESFRGSALNTQALILALKAVDEIMSA